MSKMYSQQGQGFHAVPQDQTFQQAPEVPQAQFSQQDPRLQLRPVKHQNKIKITLPYLCLWLIHVWALKGIVCSFFVNKEQQNYILYF